MAKNIDNQANNCYHILMNNYFCYERSAQGISVELTDSPLIKEREMHAYHEILYCEDSDFTLYTDNRRIKFQGDWLFVIPKGQYHLVDLSGAKRFTRLKITIQEEILKGLPVSLFKSGISAFHPISMRCELLIERLREILRWERNDSDDFFVHSATMMIIAELELSRMNTDITAFPIKDKTIMKIIDYISQDLSRNLTVKALAKIANVSPSFLTHKFKKEVGISLHRYILQKRMVSAKERIDRGESPSKIYAYCGYNDYSSFYKAYLGYFDASPSEKK